MYESLLVQHSAISLEGYSSGQHDCNKRNHHQGSRLLHRGGAAGAGGVGAASAATSRSSRLGSGDGGHGGDGRGEISAASLLGSSDVASESAAEIVKTCGGDLRIFRSALEKAAFAGSGQREKAWFEQNK